MKNENSQSCSLEFKRTKERTSQKNKTLNEKWKEKLLKFLIFSSTA